MKKQIIKTLYLHSEDETIKDGMAREAKIIKLAKKHKLTQSGAVRLMIDSYNE